ncbi:TonB-dependent receptor [Paucibacter sp. DJ2R-2]|uniref:TonB-dependent receptor n=1 Tax=Paucibacter sp. DJ2R-2 TaxID=2893558 RepID=UPI0021E3F7AE|nr:TonB-dependent receptor [Paucibacter sp. DJ2R-2]MCV2422280.1 TonB-dependent receptor [Paucibacter sp. DJ4R-1]MCV2440136.1 TonB-dependent receptor [Paucibacter sp. DJ2R-2]
MTQPRAFTPTPVLRATALAALMATAGLASKLAHAQEAPSTLNRVEVTGSAIKRLESETALPVQVITRADIVKAGITTAAELVASLSAASNSLTDGVSIGTGGFKDQMGFNSANLRGLGTSSTLVLLNGRRMANFASPGDDSGVDLNTIPMAAIQRVEVLLDGASAIYGTDAIGGVVNFITRKDYQGVQLDAYAGASKEGGAGKRSASLAGGTGDVVRDGFNLFGVLDLQRTDALSTSQRQFISDLKIPERLPHLLSSAGFPANIRLSRDQRDYLKDQGFKINGKTISGRTINLSAPACQPPHTLYLPEGIGGVDGCTYDFMRDIELYPKTDKASFLGRGVFQLDSSTQVFVETALTRSKSWYVGTSNRIDGEVDVARIPALAATGLADALPDDRSITVRTRLLDAGKRASELTSTGQRVVLGLTGSTAGWDYDLAYNRSTNKVADRDVAGYLLYDKTMAAFADGTINPFGTQSDKGLAFLRNNQINEEVRSAKGTMEVFDIKGTRALTQLAGGEMALAIGAEVRREKGSSAASALLLSDNIVGDSTPGDAQFTNSSRKVWAVYGELNAPVSKELEVQLALRHDHYDVVGSTTNPKIGLRYTPSKQVVVRASAGTGFRAPSLNDLYRPVKTGQTAVLPDPVCMKENDNDLSTCADFWETRTYANPKLKPETSKQFSFGLVIEPHPQWTVSLDYWNIAKKNVISTIGDDVILGNLSKYESLVHRLNENEGLAGCDYDEEDSTICFIELRKENRGRQRASGLDISIDLKGLKSSVGEFGVRLAGTVVLKSQKQTGFGDDYISNLGKFVTDGVVQRWRHRLTLDWTQGAYSLALSNTYSSAYTDQNSAIDTNSGTVVAPNKVKAYSLWDLSGAWNATKDLTLRAGVKNLLNTTPPYSNQAYFFLSGYDPSYTDPRGRFAYLSAQYQFR